MSLASAIQSVSFSVLYFFPHNDNYYNYDDYNDDDDDDDGGGGKNIVKLSSISLCVCVGVVKGKIMRILMGHDQIWPRKKKTIWKVSIREYMKHMNELKTHTLTRKCQTLINYHQFF